MRALHLASFAAMGLCLPNPCLSQVHELVSQSSIGVQGNGASNRPSISSSGRLVVFSSRADNLVATDANGHVEDVFLRDWVTGTTTLLSVSTSGVQGDGSSTHPSISGNGKYVAFESSATNLVAGDTNAASDIFVRDLQAGSVWRVSISSLGAESDGNSYDPHVSDDGRFVSFESDGTTLVPGDTNAARDIFLYDNATHITSRVSISTSGGESNGHSYRASVTPDGRFVVFDSLATSLVPGDSNDVSDVFCHDTTTGMTELISVSTTGIYGNGWSGEPSITSDGSLVVFSTLSTTLIPVPPGTGYQVLLRDRAQGTTLAVSMTSSGMIGDYDSMNPRITGDGRFVVFASGADNLVSGDNNPLTILDILVKDLGTGAIQLASLSAVGTASNGDCLHPASSSDGRFVTFQSEATNLLPSDTNGSDDILLHELTTYAMTNMCHPGVGGVAPCPCSNPPVLEGLGCNNSADTWGAALEATGLSYLAADSIVFSTYSERASALSILLQGNVALPTGVVYGQGVRCVGGALKRLFVKSAVFGSITAPDFGAGDPTVSAQSAAKGDTILPGQSRWYLVYYRDPNVLGGCPSTSTFNATQTGQITWWP